jgi:hypothetical protein
MAFVNGARYDGGTIEVNIEGLGAITGIQSVNYGMTKETNKVFGAGPEALARTPGRISMDDGSMEIDLYEFNNWLEKSGDHKAFMRSIFDVSVMYRIEGQPLITTVLKDCTPLNWSSAHSFQGSDNLTVTINFSVMDVGR